MQKEEKDLSIKHLAHDLNNIFTRILASIELLKLKNQDDETNSSLLNNIETGTYLASEIINSSIGKSSAQTRRINLNNMIRDIVNSFQGSASGKIKFTLMLQPKMKFVNAKYVDLYRIIMNIISNSVESIKEAGNVVVTTSLLNNDELIQIEISDDGNGIDESLYDLIFADGYSTKSAKDHSGHGLSIVKNLIELYKGTIELSSSKQNGTQFILRFPVLIDSKGKDNSQKTILIAEDENSLRFLLTELLRANNYKVLEASTGKEALELFQSNKCDLLIIDKKMPELDGLECINQIRKLNSIIPIILASGSQSTDADHIADLNISFILNKPYNFEEMIYAIEELII
jgi:CheY-like chemotaxis protein